MKNFPETLFSPNNTPQLLIKSNEKFICDIDEDLDYFPIIQEYYPGDSAILFKPQED